VTEERRVIIYFSLPNRHSFSLHFFHLEHVLPFAHPFSPTAPTVVLYMIAETIAAGAPKVRYSLLTGYYSPKNPFATAYIF
jgi:hypothetical protein